MHPCIMCLAGEGDPWNGGICAGCLPPLKPYRARRRVRFEMRVYVYEQDHRSGEGRWTS
jgi:hypothetical protein